MQRLNAHERKGCWFDFSVTGMKARLSEAVQRHWVAGHSVSYPFSIDATKILSEWRCILHIQLLWVEPIQIVTFQPLIWHQGRSKKIWNRVRIHQSWCNWQVKKDHFCDVSALSSRCASCGTNWGKTTDTKSFIIFHNRCNAAAI
jgi:hypothetical protein